MTKLYRLAADSKEYWETWDNEDGTHIVHWGVLGTQGQSKTIKNRLFRKAEKIINEEAEAFKALGFREIDDDDLSILIIEFPVNDMGDTDDLDKRHKLENRMNETLGWTGLGHCDGGSIGSGSMEVCCMVVDFEVAKTAISADLQRTEFANFSRIYLEE